MRKESRPTPDNSTISAVLADMGAINVVKNGDDLSFTWKGEDYSGSWNGRRFKMKKV